MPHGPRHPAVTVPLILLGLVLSNICLLVFGFGGCLGSYQGSVNVIDFVGPSRPDPFTLVCLRFSLSFWVLWLPLRFFVVVSSSVSFFLALSGAGETQAVLRFVVSLVFFLAAFLVFDPFDNLRTHTKAYLPHLFFLFVYLSPSLSISFNLFFFCFLLFGRAGVHALEINRGRPVRRHPQ